MNITPPAPEPNSSLLRLHMTNKKIAIIGHGRFGKLIVKVIQKNFPQNTILTFDKKSDHTLLEKYDIIIPSVPINQLENVYKIISQHAKKDAIVIDVASVKLYPVSLMKKHLKYQQCIATHPLFGPDSANNGLSGHKIVIFNVNSKARIYGKFKKVCKLLKLKTIEMSPERHDRFMAQTQGYTHLIGRIGQQMNLKSTPIDTKGFKQTLKVQSYVVNDTLELFLDMYKFNPYSKKTLSKFKKAVKKIEQLTKSDLEIVKKSKKNI